ncbi:hypothetical protein BKA56DRAFT_621437 [Ilyonectria sp. MPI-CAGE-AT-0026]|nr:hypothetical protein BKA56DRAFT_621437 [Ilyonectria sp. MPI-CAGE-AT-0026]
MPLLCCCRSRAVTQGSPSCTLQLPCTQSTTIAVPTTETRRQLTEGQPTILELSSQAEWESSQLSRPDRHGISMPQLGADGSDSEDDLPRARKKASGTFDAVRAKVIQHIRQGTSIKRQSLASIGNSDEEVARRAELKRLMHKRIQDELQTELGDDKSSNKSTPSIQCISSVTNAAMPTAGPRDNIEFAVNTLPALDSPVSLEPGLLLTTAAPYGASRHTTTQQGDRPESLQSYESYPESMNETTGTVRCLRPSIVSKEPGPASRHVSFPHSTSQKSFQLSNSTSRLDRILGPDNSFCSRRVSSSLDGQSALGVWLIAQGLRSRDNSVAPFEDTEIGNPGTQDSSHEQLRGVDRVAEALAPSIHSTIRSRTEPSLSQVPSVTDEPKKPEQSCTSAHQTDQSEKHSQGGPCHSDRVNPSHTEGILDSCALALILNSMADNTSSNYTSKLPSFQPSPARSDPNFYGLNAQDLQSFQLSPFEWHGSSPLSCDFIGSTEQVLNAPKDDQLTEFEPYANPQAIPNPSHIVYDTCSLSHSETTSFFQRETELRTIQKRFAEVLARKKLAFPIASRFREEFAEPGLGRTGRTSFINKIHLTVPRRFKSGARSQSGIEQVNSFESSQTANSYPALRETEAAHDREMSSKHKRPSNLSIRSNMHPLSPQVYQIPDSAREESTTDLWQRAIRLEAEERHSSNSHISPPPRDGRASLENRPPTLKVGLWRGESTGNSSLSTKNTNREPSHLTPKADELPASEHSKWLIQRWTTEMRPGALGNPDSIGGKCSRKLAKPPNSWARFPSHTREERVMHATTKDNVKPKDFAIKEIAPDGRVLWATDKGLAEEAPYDGTLTRSFSMRMSKAVKSKLTWFLPTKNVPEDVGKRSWKTRASSHGAKQLEYPELEILPTGSGYKELQALEKEIKNMKGRPQYLATEESLERPRSVRSLGSRISALMYEAATSNCVDHDNTPTSANIPKSPGTPASGFHSLLQESVAMTDIFVTPQSRVSFGVGTQQDHNNSDAESTKSDQPAIGRSPTAEVDTKSRLRSCTWASQSATRVPNSSRLASFRQALDTLRQNDGMNEGGGFLTKSTLAIGIKDNSIGEMP